MSRANQLRQSIEAALANPGRVLTGRAGPEPPAAGVHNSTCVHDQLSSGVVKREEEGGGSMRPQQEVYVKQEPEEALVKQEPEEEVKQEVGEKEVHMGSKDRAGGAQARRPGLDAANQNNLSLDDLRPHFFKSREDAALCLRVSINSLKAACRRNGVDRWPFRKLVSLVNLTEAMRGKASEQEQAEMQAELCKVVENPNHEVNENLVKLKLLNYKERYRLRTKGGTQPIYQRSTRSKQRSGKNCGGISMKRTRRKCQQSSPSSSSHLSADLSPRDPLTRASSLNAPGLHTHDEGTHAATHLFASTSDSGSQERVSGARGGSYSGIDAMAYITSGSCGADVRSKGGLACHKHQEQQQEYLQQQQEQQRPIHCRSRLGPTPPELSSRRSSVTLMQPIDSLMNVPRSSHQQVLEREGSVLDSCLPLPMLPATAAHAQPHHLQPTASVGGLVTAELLHPHPDRHALAPLGTTPSARSSSTHIAADPAPPPPLQLQQPTAHRLAAPWQQLQLQRSWSGPGSGSPAPQQKPPPTTQSRASFDVGTSLGGMTDCHGTDTSAQPRASLDIRAAFGGGMEYRSTTGSTSLHDDVTGSSMASGFARPAAQMAAAMRVEGFSKPQPQPPPLGKTNVHMFNEPVATYNAFQNQQQQQQQQLLSRTLLRTQPAVKAPQVKAQQLQQHHPHAVQRPWTDHTTRTLVDDTQDSPDAAGRLPLALPAVSEEETTRACVEAGRDDTQEMLPALASMPKLPFSRGLASVEYHYNDNAADTHAHSGEGDLLAAVVSQPRPGLPSQRLEQQQPPYVPQQQQHLQGQQLPQIEFGTHSLQYELHSGSNVQIGPSMFLLQEDKEEGAPDINMPSMMSMPSMGPISAVRVKEEGAMSRDCSMPSVMPTSAAQFTARLPDVRVASPPTVPMDRFQSSSFPGNTPSLQNLADPFNDHQQQQQQQQQQQRRQRGEEQPQRLDDLLDALDGFEEPLGLSDFNSAPLPRLPSFDHDMDGYFDFVVRSGMW